jgi:hypothetical protein
VTGSESNYVPAKEFPVIVEGYSTDFKELVLERY